MIYTPRYKPWPHQDRAEAKWGDREFFALFMAMRCVDGDTEYLSPLGWRKLSKYDGGLVAEFRLDGTAHFVQPKDFIKTPVDHFWHFKTQGGIDQVLSDNHRILMCGRRRRGTFGKYIGDVPSGYRTHETSATDCWRETSPKELVEKASEMSMSHFHYHVPLTFHLKTDDKIDLSDAQIRLMVAFQADGSFGTRDLTKVTNKRDGKVRLKHSYKKARLRQLLFDANCPYKEKPCQPEGFTVFSFKPPWISKTYGNEWWKANYYQRQIIADEVCNWDGRIKSYKGGAREYSSIHESDVDFIQYCFVSTGHRVSKHQEREIDGTFKLIVTGKERRTNNLALLPIPKQYEDEHDGFMYSLSVPSTYLVLRRNGKVFVTGNTGKTKVVIDHFGRLELAGAVKNLAVIAPGGVYETWEAACQDHMSADLRERALIHTWQSSGGAGYRKKLDYFMNVTDQPRILLMNVEALSAVRNARDTIVSFLEADVALGAIDESPIIGNHQSKRTQFINDKVGNGADFRVILSGLPTPRDPLQLYTQLEFLDWRILGHRSFYGYRATYAKLKDIVIGGVYGPDGEKIGGRNVKIVVGFRDLEKLQTKLEPHSYRVKLEDVYDVPAKIYMKRNVTLTSEQERIYKDLKEFCTAQLDEMSYVTATIVIAKMIRLHQVLCGHTVDEDGVEHEIPENRTKELIELLQDYDGKAIVWCSYDNDIRKVSQALEKEFGEGCTARFWGGNKPTRELEEKRFKEDDDCRFMVATPAAGGRGREWSIAHLIVYYSNTDNLDHRDQSEERGQSVGKLDAVTYVDLVAKGTVDEKIINSLRDKINMAGVIIGDSWREWLI